MGEKCYLGDSVYAVEDSGGILLTTENGRITDPSNTIFLESEVFAELVRFYNRSAVEADPRAAMWVWTPNALPVAAEGPVNHNPILRIMEEKGFLMVETSKKAVCFSKILEPLQDSFVLVTDIDGAATPTRLDQEILVGVYRLDDGSLIGDIETFAKLSDYLEGQ